jgi:methyltransferase (TIGR00027 family)
MIQSIHSIQYPVQEMAKAKAGQKSVETHPSETALSVAFLRALAAKDDREEIRCQDNLAEIFLTEEKKKPLNEKSSRSRIMMNKLSPGMYEFIIARTAYFDHIFKQALLENLPQIVILGAGYDSRAYRFCNLNQDTSIYELDAEPTQTR